MDAHLLFTYSNGPSDEKAFLQENNIQYLVKPFEVAELIAQARRLLQKAQAAAAGSD
jgi:DNA-binding response OmpR family regulator